MKSYTSAILAAILCGGFNTARARALPVLRFPSSVALKTFDPVEAEDFVTVRILMNLGRGLTVLDKNLRARPGLAENWKYSKDRKTVTFTLKKARWSNGAPLVASDFIRGFKEAFSPATSAPIAVLMTDLVAGARDYKSGNLSDFSQVGISARDERTLVITLKHPAAYFEAMLALPPFFPHPAGRDHYAIKPGEPVSGAYQMKEISNDKIVLEPNREDYEGAENSVEIRTITESSTLVNLFEKGGIDVLDKVPGSDFERFKKDAGLHSAPWLSTYYLGFNVAKGPFSNKKARTAFASAIDRRGIAKILRDPQRPSSSWVPSPLPTSDEQFGPPFDPAIAKKLWVESEAIELAFDTQDKNTVIASFIQDQIKTSLGVKISLRSMEWKSYLQFLKNEKPAFFRFGWLAAFPDPLSHLSVFTTRNPNNYTGYADPTYDALVEEISRVPEGGRRTDLIRRAQKKLLTDDVVIVPLYHYVQYVLIRPSWQGLELTPMGLIYLNRAHLRHEFRKSSF